jgi:hypothetical protein
MITSNHNVSIQIIVNNLINQDEIKEYSDYITGIMTSGTLYLKTVTPENIYMTKNFSALDYVSKQTVYELIMTFVNVKLNNDDEFRTLIYNLFPANSELVCIEIINKHMSIHDVSVKIKAVKNRK